MSPVATIPVMRPLLPSGAAIQPYLQHIDESRWYSNAGPLVNALERRLAAHFGVEPGAVVMQASGTGALVSILRALATGERRLCAMPSWTFAAVPAAAIAAGLQPYFVDVAEATWALDAAELRQMLKRVPAPIGAIVVVAPFGAPLNMREWEAFTEDTGIPVAIDAAAGFDAVACVPAAAPGNCPVAISLHATKAFGIGEGGMVICRDSALAERVRQVTNFGLTPERTIAVPGINGKMSEYAAAVGHAALDEWPAKRAQWQERIGWCMEVLEGMDARLHMSGAWVTSTANVQLPDGNADMVAARLASRGIETRRWWDNGCHAFAAYGTHPREPLPVTERLARSVLGLPFAVDITKHELLYVAGALRELLQ